MINRLIEPSSGTIIIKLSGTNFFMRLPITRLIYIPNTPKPVYLLFSNLVILQPTVKQLAELGTDQDKVYQFVQEAFNRKFSIYWLKPIGFNNA